MVEVGPNIAEIHLKHIPDHTGNGSKRMYIYGEFSETPKGTKINDRKSIASI